MVDKVFVFLSALLEKKIKQQNVLNLLAFGEIYNMTWK